eukprot:6820187-Pyramimonas_sp.AAC.1
MSTSRGNSQSAQFEGRLAGGARVDRRHFCSLFLTFAHFFLETVRDAREAGAGAGVAAPTAHHDL